MNQPDLGKKIVELRKAKGLTQEELVDKCNLNVRTLQRIESGEVSPRSYTIKTIFAALDYSIFDSSENMQNESGKTGVNVSNWLEQFYKYFIDLFNLKTNTMKKISILSVTIFTVSFFLFTVCSENKAQSPAKVRRIIEEANKDFIGWFNNGQIDSLVALYRDDACLVARGCGKEFIYDYYKAESKKYKFNELTIYDITLSDTVAVEKGQWSIILDSGEKVGGEYLTEWRLTHKKWLMVSDLANIKED